MTINVYQSIMPGEPAEIYNDSGLTVEQFMQSMTSKYRRSECQPVTCAINGAIVKPLDWHDAWIGENDIVDIRPVPHGDALNVVFPFWAGTINVAVTQAFNYLIPDIPGQRGQGQQGTQIEPSEARANTARLGEAIPEGMGLYIRYPDYLSQPRRLYVDTKTQELRLMLCVGVGSYQIDGNSVKIGDTAINDLANASFTVYEPGANLASDPNHENWYSSKEVGATSSSAGIRLGGITFDERTYFGNATVGSSTVTSIISVGEKWEEGITGSIKMFVDVTVTDDPAADIITGNFQNLLLGMTVHVESTALPFGGGNTYVVRSINGTKSEITLETTGGSPVTNLNTGSHTMSIDKDGTKYLLDTIVSSSSILVERILDNGSPDPDWDVLPTSSNIDVEIEWEAISFTANFAGPFSACPDNETTDEFEVDIFLPQGMGVIDDESINLRSRTVRIQWREIGTTIWSTQDETVSGKTRDQLGFTFTVNLGSAIRPEVRVARIGDEDVSVTSLDRIEFTALRSKLPTVTSYDDVTVMSVTITGSNEIASQSNNRVNLEALRKLPEISGGALTAPVATSKISAAAVYVAKSLGYDDDQIDLDQFETLESTWTSRGDRFDYVFSDTTAMRAIETILRAGFSEMTLDTGIITPVRDEPRTILEDGYSPENMIGPLRREFQTRQVDEPDGVEVEFVDGNTWTVETVNAFLPGDLGVKVDKIKVDGVTDRTRAWRIGMRRRRAQKYRRWTYTFSTELDALNSSYLSYVPLLDDIPGYGKVSILTSISSDRITVSEPLEFVSGQTHVVAYRDEDGNVVGPFTATQGPDEYTALVTIPEPFPPVRPSNQEPTHVYFGTSDRWHFPSLITEIRPSGPLTVDVTATNYDDRLYDDDDNAPT